MERKIPSFTQDISESNQVTFSLKKQLIQAFISPCQFESSFIPKTSTKIVEYTDDEIIQYRKLTIDEKILLEI